MRHRNGEVGDGDDDRRDGALEGKVKSGGDPYVEDIPGASRRAAVINNPESNVGARADVLEGGDVGQVKWTKRAACVG